MLADSRLSTLREESLRELTEHILPYWASHTPDDRRGGFFGQITGDGVLVEEAPRGAVLHARLLWTFSAAARTLSRAGGGGEYHALADHAYTYLRDHFADGEYGGVFWTVEADGAPLDTKKQTYAQAFAIYGLAEYARLTGSKEALRWAAELFELLEHRAADSVHGGYTEALSREWASLDDVRLSEKDEHAPKSMNTHLHVMEAYANLYRTWPDARLRSRLEALVLLFLDRVVHPETRHQICFFEADWAPSSDTVSFGHDIETSWLLVEAAEVLGDVALLKRTQAVAVEMAYAVLRGGVDEDGGLVNEIGPGGHVDTDKHWWPQAEAVVGFLNAYELSNDPAFLEMALRVWTFILKRIADREGGEWHFRVSRDGIPYREEDKVGLWKCPYHNARACMEVLRRADREAQRTSTPRALPADQPSPTAQITLPVSAP